MAPARKNNTSRNGKTDSNLYRKIWREKKVANKIYFNKNSEKKKLEKKFFQHWPGKCKMKYRWWDEKEADCIEHRTSAKTTTNQIKHSVAVLLLLVVVVAIHLHYFEGKCSKIGKF